LQARFAWADSFHPETELAITNQAAIILGVGGLMAS